MTDKQQHDPTGRLLQRMATRVEREVIPPDPRFITQRATLTRRRRKYRLLTVAAAVIVVAGGISAGVIIPGGSPTGHGRQGQSPGVASYPIRFGNVRLVVKDLPAIQKDTTTIASSRITTLHMPVITPNYSSIAFGGGHVWVLEHTGDSAPGPCGQLVEVDAASATVTGSVPISLCPDAVAYGAGSVWVLSSQIGVTGYQLVQVDPSALTVVSTITLDGGSDGVTPRGDTGAKYLFVTVDGNDVIAAIQAQAGNTQLIEVDATSGTTIRSVPVPSPDGPVTGLGANNSAVWVGTANGWVLSLDLQSGALPTGRRLGTRVASLSASNSGIWVTVNLPVPSGAAYPGLDTLRLDPTTGVIENDTGLPMVFVATDGTSVWELSSAPPYQSADGLVGQVDQTTGQLNEQAELPVRAYNTPDTLGVYDRAAWVIDDGVGTLTKVSP